MVHATLGRCGDLREGMHVECSTQWGSVGGAAMAVAVSLLFTGPGACPLPASHTGGSFPFFVSFPPHYSPIPFGELSTA